MKTHSLLAFGATLTASLLVTAAATSSPIDLIRRGKRVREIIRQIDENGGTLMLVNTLENNGRVDVLHVGTTPLVPEGRVGATSFPNATNFTLTGDRDTRYFSHVSRLICSNDGFTALRREGQRRHRRE